MYLTGKCGGEVSRGAMLEGVFVINGTKGNDTVFRTLKLENNGEF